jgi:1-acyl-sn-glycerol-3-phosphate acyltransferase
VLIYAVRLALLPCIIIGFLLGARVPTQDYEVLRAALRAGRSGRRVCRILGIRIRLGSANRRRAGGSLTVLNHLSWVDTALLVALRPSVFVTSTETGEHPLFGRICAGAGCVFMERRQRGSLCAERDRIAQLMGRLPIVVFPEATSSNGDAVLPFKPAAFAAAITARAPIHLLALRYRRIDGRPIGRHNRDRIYWYGDMAFAPHLLGLLAIRRIDVDLDDVGYLPPVSAADRKALAAIAHRIIASAVDPASGPGSAKPLSRAA